MVRALPGALRAYQWPKNLIVFAPLIFAEQIHLVEQQVRSAGAFLVLCAASSAVYILNDLMDIEKDRRHPTKSKRPIASGAVSVPAAVALLIGLAAAAAAGAASLSLEFLYAVLFYIA